jgi:hypothetical protein
MQATTSERPTLVTVLLALIVPACLLLIGTHSLERLSLLSTSVRLWLQNFGLLAVSVALCVLSYWRERRLAEWSLPGLGVALVVLATGAGAHLLLFPVGVALTDAAVAAALRRPVLHWSWEAWLLMVLVAGTVLAAVPMWPPAGPPTAPADPAQMTLPAILRGPQVLVSVCGLFGIYAIMIGRGLSATIGLRASLVLVGTLSAVWTAIGDPAYALGLWTENRALIHFMEALSALTLTVTVLAVIAAPSDRALWLSFVLPIGAGLLTELVVDILVRPNASLTHSLSTASVYLLPLVVALWLCGRSVSRPGATLVPA